MKVRLFSLVVAVLIFAGSFEDVLGCLNEYRPNIAARQKSEALVAQLTEHPVTEDWTVRRERLRELLAKGGDFRVKNDLATTLLHTGEPAEAVKLLTEIEAEKPGLYFTAANLGTAYELSGDDQQALVWIQKGIERDPTSHEGSEWLHVKILQAKIAIAEDPKWLETHSVLTSAPRLRLKENALGNRGERLAPEQVKAAIIYQLHERLQFVPSPEFVVGDLLMDLFDLVSAGDRSQISAGKGVLRLAGKYLEGLDSDHPLARDLYFAQVFLLREADHYPSSPEIIWLPTLAVITVVGLVVGLGVVWLLRRRRRA